MNDHLGRLQRVELREIWESESSGFTPWLAQPENLQLLAETLDMELELEAQERSVGEFRADILCKDLTDDHWVLIENQLERTDHGHLGQLLTYASGLQAVTIVWIASRFAEPHRAALDWLNEITDHRFRFFGLEVELWRIGESVAAPKFNIVSKPNDWTRSVGRAARQIDAEDMTDLRKTMVEFWTALKAHLLQRRSRISPRGIKPQQWLSVAIGRAGYRLGALYVATKKRVGVELYISHSQAHAAMQLLEQQRDETELEIGSSLEWIKASKHARIAVYFDVPDPYDRARWPQYIEWLTKTLEQFDTVFRKRIRALPDFGNAIASGLSIEDDEDA